MPDSRYAKNAEAVFSLTHHLAWCRKYRRPVLVPPVDARLNELLAEVAKEHEMTIHAAEVMPDHVHLRRATRRCALPRSSIASEATVRRYIEAQKGM